MLFGLESWAMLEAMKRTVDGNHISFIRQSTGKSAIINIDSTWATLLAGEVLREARIKTAATYISRRKGVVPQWISLRPISEDCAWGL